MYGFEIIALVQDFDKEFAILLLFFASLLPDRVVNLKKIAPTQGENFNISEAHPRTF